MTMLKKYEYMFGGYKGRITFVKHHIELVCENVSPFAAHYYRARQRSRDLKRIKLDDILRVGIGEANTTEWASPIVLPPKKDGTPWLYIN